jgi:hypothetical protein
MKEYGLVSPIYTKGGAKHGAKKPAHWSANESAGSAVNKLGCELRPMIQFMRGTFLMFDFKIGKVPNNFIARSPRLEKVENSFIRAAFIRLIRSGICLKKCVILLRK